MLKYTRVDIDRIIESQLQKKESIDLFVGKGKDKRLVIKKGLKLEDELGLVYHVMDVGKVGSGYGIRCIGPDGEIIIKSQDFDAYKVKR